MCTRNIILCFIIITTIIIVIVIVITFAFLIIIIIIIATLHLCIFLYYYNKDQSSIGHKSNSFPNTYDASAATIIILCIQCVMFGFCFRSAVILDFPPFASVRILESTEASMLD